jgi:oxygen-independent coproporphyrinogen-3 oxidase
MVHDAKDAGMDIVHIDLMYGLPGQTPMQWQEDVERAVELGVQHISAYPLIVFQHQLLSRSILAGTVPEQPSSALIYEMQQYASSVFERAGFERYSLTEFATPGHRCRYVTSNWNGSDYLGFGPGAYSRKGNELWENSVLHSEYEEALRNLRRPIGRDINMSPRQALERDLSLGLCLISVDTSNLEKRTSLRVSEEFGNLIDELQQQRLVRFENGTLSLTTYGIRHATHVMKLFTSQSTSITRRDQWQSRQVAS